MLVEVGQVWTNRKTGQAWRVQRFSDRRVFLRYAGMVGTSLCIGPQRLLSEFTCQSNIKEAA